MNHADSGLAHGTNGSPQLTTENGEMEAKVKENESKVDAPYVYDHDAVIDAINSGDTEYLRTKLSQTSPIRIPENAQISAGHKDNGYEQVSYKWSDAGYKYESRWHTHTPNAPEYSQDSWVVERVRPGIGAGKNARPRVHEYKIKGRGWVDDELWDKAKSARKLGKETTEQRELLDNGHWKVE